MYWVLKGEKTKFFFKKLQELWIWLEILEKLVFWKKKRGRKRESIYKYIIGENFPNLEKDGIWVHEANRTSCYLNTKRLSPRHFTMKLSKTNDKETILKAAGVGVGEESNLQRNPL